MKPTLVLLFVLLFSINAVAQTSADSVTITFRAYEATSPPIYLPGQFNGWNNNSSATQMTYDTTLTAWLKTYTFKIKDPSDGNRTMGDSIYMYKLNRGGVGGDYPPTGWYSDPLNPEKNASDHSNSVLRLTTLFWFQYYQATTGDSITRITVGVEHTDSDTLTSLTLSYAPTQSQSLTTLDVLPQYNSITRILDITLATRIHKSHYLRLTAINNHGDTIVYAKGGYVLPPQLPVPGYAKKGVNLPSVAIGDSVLFYIEVPTSKSYVLVRVAPPGQSLETVTPVVMRKHTGNAGWWIKTKLDSGTYNYVYELEGGQRITDPYSRNITAEGYSTFSIGPAGLTDDDYVWNDGTFQRSPMNKLVLYELNVNEFAGGYFDLDPGDVKWSHMINLLPYFDSLGINGIELMPVTDYSGIGASGFSWGYDVNSYLALEPSFGTPGEFKEFVDSAHGRGIAVIMDMVFNHLTEGSTLWLMQPSESSNPYFKLLSDKRPNEDDLGFFKDIDHWTTETQDLVYTALKLWIDDYHIDGFRYDFTQGIGWNRFDTTKGILGWANKIRKDYNNSIYQIAEHLPESPALIYYSGLTGGWHDSFRDKVFDLARNASVSLTDVENLIIGLNAFGSNDTPSVPSVYANRTEPVNACSNHDEQGLLFEMMTYQGVPESTALRRDKLYATFMFASLGIPMLWEGIEFSAPRGWVDPHRLDYRPVEWNYYDTEQGRSHFHYYKTLINQRIHNPALYQGTLVKQWKYNTEKVLVWGFNDADTGAMVQIIANLGNVQKTVNNVPWLAAGTWYDVFDQSTFYADSTTLASFTIPAYTARVFSSRSDAELGIPLGVDDGVKELPSGFSLEQNYPNPFNPSTVIRYSLSVNSYVTLKVYDVLGREVATLADGMQDAGFKSHVWDATGLPSGVYFYKLNAVGQDGILSYSKVKKMLLLR
ncbi:MAG: T9SS type A sorting domain-containing protein [Bacteroidetes bacterium]|nr:MAG: T9SS type A sorting domain-containing protein [Bacteroidota bacterium]